MTLVAWICAGCGDFGILRADEKKIFENGVVCPQCKNGDADWVVLGETGKRRASKFLAHGLDVNGKV